MCGEVIVGLRGTNSNALLKGFVELSTLGAHDLTLIRVLVEGGAGGALVAVFGLFVVECVFRADNFAGLG